MTLIAQEERGAIDSAEMAASSAATSVNKALLLLDCFRSAGPSLGVSEIARLAGVPKSTTFRLLSHLRRSGYVERHGTAYRLGWRVFELGNRVPQCQPYGLRDISRPYMIDLHIRTALTVHLGVLEGNDVVYLRRSTGSAQDRPPHGSAAGCLRHASAWGRQFSPSARPRLGSRWCGLGSCGARRIRSWSQGISLTNSTPSE